MKRMVLGMVLAGLAVLAFSGCSEADKQYTVKYEITGPAYHASIYFINENGKSEEVSENIPWEKTINITGKDINLSCYVFFDSWYNRNYTVNIYVNGTLKATESSNGSSTIYLRYTIK